MSDAEAAFAAFETPPPRDPMSATEIDIFQRSRGWKKLEMNATWITFWAELPEHANENKIFAF